MKELTKIDQKFKKLSFPESINFFIVKYGDTTTTINNDSALIVHFSIVAKLDIWKERKQWFR